MVEISENAKKALKIIFTDYLNNYNSYNIRNKLGISDVGSLKLLRNLKDKGILIAEKMGNAIFYKANLQNQYTLKLLELIFLDYGNLSTFVKGWIYDLRSFSKVTESALLFGSILRKNRSSKDVDVCFILKNYKDYSKVQNKVNEINKKNRLKIHPLYLTEKEFENKLKEKDKPLVNMVKDCMIIHGVELFVKVLKDVQS